VAFIRGKFSAPSAICFAVHSTEVIVVAIAVIYIVVKSYNFKITSKLNISSYKMHQIFKSSDNYPLHK
jgi:hypothetical protein